MIVVHVGRLAVAFAAGAPFGPVVCAVSPFPLALGAAAVCLPRVRSEALLAAELAQLLLGMAWDSMEA